MFGPYFIANQTAADLSLFYNVVEKLIDRWHFLKRVTITPLHLASIYTGCELILPQQSCLFFSRNHILFLFKDT